MKVYNLGKHVVQKHKIPLGFAYRRFVIFPLGWPEEFGVEHQTRSQKNILSCKYVEMQSQIAFLNNKGSFSASAEFYPVNQQYHQGPRFCFLLLGFFFIYLFLHRWHQPQPKAGLPHTHMKTANYRTRYFITHMWNKQEMKICLSLNIGHLVW